MSAQEGEEEEVLPQVRSPHQIPPQRYPFFPSFLLLNVSSFLRVVLDLEFCTGICFSLTVDFGWPRDDAVYDELLKAVEEAAQGKETKALPRDEDLPGMGQFYCLHCDRYFANETVRNDHFRSKLHKKRVKQMEGPAPHTQLDAELAAGMGMPDNGPKLMSS